MCYILTWLPWLLCLLTTGHCIGPDILDILNGDVQAKREEFISTVSLDLSDVSVLEGRLFQYQLPINAFKEKLQAVQITEVGRESLPPWIYYNRSSHTLVGIPDTAGQFFIQVDISGHSDIQPEVKYTKDKDRSHQQIFYGLVPDLAKRWQHWSAEKPSRRQHWSATDVFRIRVCSGTTGCYYDPHRPVSLKKFQTSQELASSSSPPSFSSSSSPPPSPPPSSSSQSHCPRDVFTYFANIVLDASWIDLSVLERIKMLQDLSDFIQVSVEKITMKPYRGMRGMTVNQELAILMAGQGNVQHSTLSSSGYGVLMSWPISCGEFKLARDFSQVLDHNVKGGRLTNEIGRSIIGWHITAYMPTRSEKSPMKKRVKRQLNQATPFPATPSLSSVQPTRLVTLTTVTEIEATSTSTYMSSSQISEQTSSTFILLSSSTDSLESFSTLSSEEISPAHSSVLPSISESVTEEPSQTLTISSVLSTTIVPHLSSDSTTPVLISSTFDAISGSSISYTDSALIESSTAVTTTFASSSSLVDVTTVTTLTTSVTVNETVTTTEVSPPIVSTTTTTTTTTEDETTTEQMTTTTTTDTETTTVSETTTSSTEQPTTTTTSLTTSTEGDLTTITNATIVAPTTVAVSLTTIMEETTTTVQITTTKADMSTAPEKVIEAASTTEMQTTTATDTTSKVPTTTTASPLTTNIANTTLQPTTSAPATSNATEADTTTTIQMTTDRFIREITTTMPAITTETTNITLKTTTSTLAVTTEDLTTTIETVTTPITTIFFPRTTTTTMVEVTTPTTTVTEPATTKTTTTKIVSTTEDVTTSTKQTTPKETTTTERITTLGDITTTTTTTPETYTTPELTTTPMTTTVKAETTTAEAMTTTMVITTQKPTTTTTTPKTSAKETTTSESTTPLSTTTTNTTVTTTDAETTTEKEITSEATTLPGTTTSFPTTTVETTTVLENQPPILYNQFDNLRVLQGEYFSFLVPRDTFHDREDGHTRRLNLSLLLGQTGELVGPASWVQLDEQNQIIYGVPVPDTDSFLINPQEFHLMAEDSGGLFNTEVFHIHINTSSVIDISHAFVLSLDLEYSGFINDTRNLITLMEKIGKYMGDQDARFVTVLSVTNGSVVVNWSNNTFSKVICQNESIQFILYKMVDASGNVNSSFSSTLLPGFPVISVQYRPLGVCVTGDVVPPIVSVGAVAIDNYYIYLVTVIPALGVVLILLLIGLIACILYRRRRDSGDALIREDKPTYNAKRGKRKPVILPEELELQEVDRKPKKPLFLFPEDSDPVTGGGGGASRPPPKDRPQPPAPPPYRLPNFDFDWPDHGDQVTPPPSYHSGSGRGPPRPPPPSYRLPPPYLAQQGDSSA